MKNVSQCLKILVYFKLYVHIYIIAIKHCELLPVVASSLMTADGKEVLMVANRLAKMPRQARRGMQTVISHHSACNRNMDW